MYARFPWQLVAYTFGSAEHTLGATGTDIELFNLYIIIFKMLNDACELRYFHTLLPRDVPREPKTCSFSNHSFH